MDQQDLIQIASMVYDCLEQVQLLENNILEIRSEIAEKYPTFLSFLLHRPPQAREVLPQLQALPESLRALILRTLVLKRAINDVKEFLDAIETPADTEAVETESRLDTLPSLHEAITNIAESSTERLKDRDEGN